MGALMNFFSDVGYYHSGLLFFKIIEPAAIGQPFETRSEWLELQKFVNSKYVIVLIATVTLKSCAHFHQGFEKFSLVFKRGHP